MFSCRAAPHEPPTDNRRGSSDSPGQTMDLWTRTCRRRHRQGRLVNLRANLYCLNLEMDAWDYSCHYLIVASVELYVTVIFLFALFTCGHSTVLHRDKEFVLEVGDVLRGGVGFFLVFSSCCSLRLPASCSCTGCLSLHCPPRPKLSTFWFSGYLLMRLLETGHGSG